MTQDLATRVESLIEDVPDFPKPGIIFKDITPLLLDPDVFDESVRAMIAPFSAESITKILAIESRGFLFGVPASKGLQAGLVLARKAGKLPRNTIKVEYDLEYGTDVIEVHADAMGTEDRVLVIDDVLATGGTAAAAVETVRRAGSLLVGCAFLIELEGLNGRAKLDGVETNSLLKY